MSRLPRSFFARPTLIVARELLGQRLVKIEGGKRLSGIITEVEAYIGEKDLACHARAGRTARTEVMYWNAGHLYVYFTYGMHWMMNFITERDGFPAAVLLRALEAEEGITVMRTRRKKSDHLTDGPAKIAQAFGIDNRWNGVDICAADSKLFIESTQGVAASRVIRSPRVGLGSTPEPWLSKKWNFKMNNETMNNLELPITNYSRRHSWDYSLTRPPSSSALPMIIRLPGALPKPLPAKARHSGSAMPVKH